MKVKIDWLVRKSPEWIIATLLQEDGTKLDEVSINKTSKKGEPFPNFDGLMPGHEIEGELWTSSAGKHYLFPPRIAKTAQGGAFKSKQIEEAQTRKKNDIEHFQTTKEESIRLASAQRDAVIMVATIFKDQVVTPDHLRSEIINWRNWFLNDQDFNNPPPF